MLIEGYVRTDDTATAADLRELFSMDGWDGIEDETEELLDTIETHSGEWRRESDVWRWWQHESVEID